MVEDRRAEMSKVWKKLEEGDARMERIENSIEKILSIIETAEGFFKVAGWLASVAKVLLGLGTAAVIFYNLIFHPPKA